MDLVAQNRRGCDDDGDALQGWMRLRRDREGLVPSESDSDAKQGLDE